MEGIRNFFMNAGWTMVFDAVVLIIALVAISIFFFKKRNAKAAVILLLYVIVSVAVQMYSAYSNGSYLYIASEVLRYANIFVIVAFCVAYQNDLKNGFLKFGHKNEDSQYTIHGNSEDELIDSANEIVKAVQVLSKNDTGALIVLCPDSVPGSIVDTGTKLNCLVSSAVLQSIFNTKSPLHDGAVVIKNNTIIAAGCFLPLTQRNDISKDLGTRHRAAIGVTEECNVFSIVVSEETGIVSVVHRHGEYKRFITGEKLLDELASVYGISVLSRLRKHK